MIDVNDLRKGVIFEMDGDLYRVMDYEHHKPGRGAATIRIKARNMRTGANIDKTFSSGLRVQDVRLDYHNVQYLYNDGDFFYFMDQDTFEQPAIPAKVLGEDSLYLTEGINAKITFYGTEPLAVELPLTVDMEVVEAEVAVRGDTATGVNKKITTETGLTVSVPGFVNTGDRIRVDTRTGAYVTRV